MRGGVIVETRTPRGGTSNCLKDGCSTILFGDWAHKNSALLFSVDIDLEAIACASNALVSVCDSVYFEESDFVTFLQNFNQPIDFFYLDSFGYDINNPSPSQEHHLREFQAAYS